MRRRSQSDGYLPYALLLPGLAFYALFVLVPIYQTFRLSLYEWNGLMPEQWVGLDNFTDLLGDRQIQSAFKVSLVFVFFSCLMPVSVGLVIAGSIARTRIRGLTFFRFVFFLPYTIALAVVAIGWRWLYASDGSINQIVAGIFGPGSARAVLGDFTLALPAVGFVSFWTTFGFVVVLLLSGTQHISRQLYEAARVDGAGPVREFLAVTLPGIRHELRVSLLVTFIFAMRAFDLPLLMTQGGPGYSTTTPSLTMFRSAFINGQIGRGAAIAVLITIITMAGVVLITRLLVTEETGA